MIFRETPINGAFIIDLEKHGDERGFFARAFCKKEFEAHGLSTRFVQVNNSSSVSKGTLRGMHYQLAPMAETKVVRCIRGRVWDAMIDLREASPSFGKWFGVELSDENRRAVYVPKGFAHGFLTLAENSEVWYLVDEFYAVEHERGIRWDDATFGIEWPSEPAVISEKDLSHPDFDRQFHLAGAP